MIATKFGFKDGDSKAGMDSRPAHRLKENLGAADVELTADDLASIQDALGRIEVQGERYPPNLAALVGR